MEMIERLLLPEARQALTIYPVKPRAFRRQRPTVGDIREQQGRQSLVRLVFSFLYRALFLGKSLLISILCSIFDS